MATVNFLKCGAPVPRTLDSAVGSWTTEIDFAVNNGTSGDVWQIMTIPKNMWIKDVLVYNTTAEGGAGTLDVVVTGGTTFINDFDVNSAGGMDRYMNPTTTAAQTGQLYVAEDTLDILLNASLDAAKVRITVEYLMTSALQ